VRYRTARKRRRDLLTMAATGKAKKQAFQFKGKYAILAYDIPLIVTISSDLLMIII